MDAQDLVSGIRWSLLQSIARQPSTGADLAREFGTSPANITQHLKLLELGGLVIKERVNGKSMHYKIKGETALLTLLTDPPQRAVIDLDLIDKLALQLLATQKPYAPYLRRFVFRYDEVVRNFIAFGVLSYDQDIQLLVITEDVRPLRKEYANLHVGDKKIVIWSHTPNELQEGLQHKEAYFMDKIKSLTVLHDPTQLLTRLQEKYR